MFLRRNVAGQVFVIPGSLRAIADGSAVTSGSVTVVKDGTASAGAGTLTHVSTGAFKYAPTQGETDCQIFGFILEGTGAVTLCGSIRTTNSDPNDATRLGLAALPNIAPTSPGGLITSGIGLYQLDTSGGKVKALLSASDVTGNVHADLQSVLGSALTAVGGTASAGGANTLTLQAGQTFATDALKYRKLGLTGNTGAGQQAIIIGNTNANPSVLTVLATGASGNWTVQPDNTTTYEIGDLAVVILAPSQPSYAPAKAGDAMALTTDERAALADAVLEESVADHEGVALSLAAYVKNMDDDLTANAVILQAIEPTIQTNLDAKVSLAAKTADFVTPDAGTVSASPTPTTSTFTATSTPNTAGLNAPSGGYPVAGMHVYFLSGTMKGQKYGISGHTAAGPNHAFVVEVMPTAPAAGDRFIVI